MSAKLKVRPASAGLMQSTLPVYSDFSHMNGNLQNLTFAVGLREEKPQAMLNRILPLQRVVPGKFSNQHKEIDDVEEQHQEKDCIIQECINRKMKYNNQKEETLRLLQELLDTENIIKSVQNKITLTEKSINKMDEKNDSVKHLIDDVSQRLPVLENDINKGKQINETLELELQQLLINKEDLRTQRKREKESCNNLISSDSITLQSQNNNNSRRNSNDSIKFIKTNNNLKLGTEDKKLIKEIKNLKSFMDLDSDDDTVI
jgi:chromosome segregation ATPase